jgi:hypothetical protein
LAEVNRGLRLLAWRSSPPELTFCAAEITVVRARRLWPRSLFGDSLRDAEGAAPTA